MSIFAGHFALGFFSRFVVALVILIFCYSQAKQDKYLRRGIAILITMGAIALVLILFSFFAFFTLGGFSSLFAGLHNLIPFGFH